MRAAIVLETELGICPRDCRRGALYLERVTALEGVSCPVNKLSSPLESHRTKKRFVSPLAFHFAPPVAQVSNGGACGGSSALAQTVRTQHRCALGRRRRLVRHEVSSLLRGPCQESSPRVSARRNSQKEENSLSISLTDAEPKTTRRRRLTQRETTAWPVVVSFEAVPLSHAS